MSEQSIQVERWYVTQDTADTFGHGLTNPGDFTGGYSSLIELLDDLASTRPGSAWLHAQSRVPGGIPASLFVTRAADSVSWVPDLPAVITAGDRYYDYESYFAAYKTLRSEYLVAAQAVAAGRAGSSNALFFLYSSFLGDAELLERVEFSTCVDYITSDYDRLSVVERSPALAIVGRDNLAVWSLTVNLSLYDFRAMISLEGAPLTNVLSDADTLSYFKPVSQALHVSDGMAGALVDYYDGTSTTQVAPPLQLWPKLGTDPQSFYADGMAADIRSSNPDHILTGVTVERVVAPLLSTAGGSMLLGGAVLFQGVDSLTETPAAVKSGLEVLSSASAELRGLMTDPRIIGRDTSKESDDRLTGEDVLVHAAVSGLIASVIHVTNTSADAVGHPVVDSGSAALAAHYILGGT